jgi:predicted transcriptional regulator
MKRIQIYLDPQAFEELKKLAESRKQSLSQLARDMIFESLRTGELKDRLKKLELKENGDFTELNEEMNMIWEVTGKLDKALRKLNRGETLEESDFMYSEESVKQ